MRSLKTIFPCAEYIFSDYVFEIADNAQSSPIHLSRTWLKYQYLKKCDIEFLFTFLSDAMYFDFLVMHCIFL